MIVVSDATPLNILVRVGEVDVLPKLFGRVIAPGAVLEALSKPQTPELLRAWSSSPPSWLEIRSPSSILNLKTVVDKLRQTDFEISEALLDAALERDSRRRP